MPAADATGDLETDDDIVIEAAPYNPNDNCMFVTTLVFPNVSDSNYGARFSSYTTNYCLCWFLVFTNVSDSDYGARLSNYTTNYYLFSFFSSWKGSTRLSLESVY